MLEAMLYEHEDGRQAVSFIVPAPFSHGDPKWHRVGPVEVYGVDAAKAAEAELDRVLAEYRDASEEFDAEVLARFIKAHPKHADALRRYSMVQLTFVPATREEIEAEEAHPPVQGNQP